MVEGKRVSFVSLVAVVASSLLLLPNVARAHCDTLSGPVVKDAERALAAGDVTPVLKWVRPEDEAEVRSAFERTMQVRALGEEAMRLADWWFFETLVRIHRLGEGAPYTGLKSGEEVDAGIEMADEALATGSVAGLIDALSAHLAEGVRSRFERVAMASSSAEDSVAEGRQWVHAYVEFIHYVEGLTQVLEGGAEHAHTAESSMKQR